MEILSTLVTETRQSRPLIFQTEHGSYIFTFLNVSSEIEEHLFEWIFPIKNNDRYIMKTAVTGTLV